VAGEANRKIFFTERSLDVSQGYRIFLGAPNLLDINIKMGEEAGGITLFSKRMLSLFHRDRVIEGATNTYVLIAES
jgi:hypothetical protein